MDVTAQVLLEQIQSELKGIRAHIHRLTVRRGVLQRASLMLGTGVSAADVRRVVAPSARSSSRTAKRPSNRGPNRVRPDAV